MIFVFLFVSSTGRSNSISSGVDLFGVDATPKEFTFVEKHKFFLGGMWQ